MKILLASTPVGGFGSGIGGGVELTIQNLARELLKRGHDLHLLASSGSSSTEMPVISIPGELHSFAQNQSRSDLVGFPHNSVLANMWEYIRQVQYSYDLVVNFAYDWLPFYLTPFLHLPVAHFVSMGSLLDAIDLSIAQVHTRFPGTIGVYTHIQAHTFAERVSQVDQFRVLGSGIDLDLYDYQSQPEPAIAWVARIAPEKGLEDAAAVSERTGKEIRVLGKMQDPGYWEQVQRDFPGAKLNYLGFHPTLEMQQILGKCEALLMTPKWIEAFGNVAIEALACGVPVVSYGRGGPMEIVHHEQTGFLVEPDNLDALCDAVRQVGKLHRHACRRQAERQFSLAALGDRFEQWFADLVTG
ncbi:MAG: glycosyltransferase [Pseudanabaenaceae cyanobacterium bins.68]|nr:glycosyltransferase [Pseudanabaenaceae cyanobacterium bins.68]